MALARSTEHGEDTIVSKPQHLKIGDVYVVCRRTMCGGVWARTFQTTNGNLGPRNASSVSSCLATVILLAPGLGPQIWGLPGHPQRARSCGPALGTKIGRVFGAQKHVGENAFLDRHANTTVE